MSDRYKGAILSPTAPTVTPQSAGGIYTSSQQLQYQGQGVWPTAFNNPLTNSLRFRSSASAYLSRTPASAGNQQKFTWSGWVKRGTLGTSTTIFGCYSSGTLLETTYFDFRFNTDYLDANWGNGTWFTTTVVYRDPSAWYHIVLAVDTTQATASNRMILYVNGVQVTAFSYTSYPAQNTNLVVNTASGHTFGKAAFNSSAYLDGYLAEVNFIDGVALTPSSFGTTDAYGIWQPIPYTGAYGTNGFYLPFTDNSALTTSSNAGLGKDFSGNGNYWVTNNISITAGSTYDSMKDVPTNTNSNTANYCVMNPLDAQGTATLTDANLTLASSSTTHRNRKATFVVPSTGKWYWELTTASTCSSSVILGWGLQTTAAATDSQAGNANTWMAQNDANQDIWNQTTNVLSTGSAVAGGSIRQVAYDADSGKLWFGVNNTWYSSTDLTSGNPSAGTNPCITLTSGSYFPAVTCYNLTANVNFGQRPFSYTPPSGFYPLNTYNLSTPTILDGDQYFDATLYTGNGSTQSITNSGSFQPDLVWIKGRSSSSQDHTLVDFVRGISKTLRSNSTTAELNQTGFNVTAFNSNGFSVTDDTNGSYNVNGSVGGTFSGNAAYVAWQWKANGAGSTNTAGSITSTVSANTTAGFSIATFTTPGGYSTGTVGHGLGVAPSMIIVKNRTAPSGANNWNTFHTSIGNTGALYLNSTAATTTSSAFWNNTSPTSSVFTVGTNLYASTDYVAYCFAQVAGYSAFGSYVGNSFSAGADGTFVYLGFRPRFVLVKLSSSSGYDWVLYDSARSPTNVTQNYLNPSTSNSENAGGTVADIDFLSNGFKLRNNSTSAQGTNIGNQTYIYAAFAENPFKIARAR